MRVAFLYNDASEDPACETDDDAAASPIVDAINRAGHTTTLISCTLDLADVRRKLKRARPDVVFNRVDSLGGTDAMMPAITLLLDSLGLPYTGCRTSAIVATGSKIAAKKRLVEAGLPTPAWVTRDSTLGGVTSQRSQFVVKSVFEHASFQIDLASLIGPTTVRQVVRHLEKHELVTGRTFFAEEFIDGREFNLALWEGAPAVLPPAEIDFSAYPNDRPHIVGHLAKCDVDSEWYDQTERKWQFDAVDGPLLKKLIALAGECWRLFGLSGYARIDFRVDALGQPWILEVNTNPCLSPDAGFAAAAAQAGIDYDQLIERILNITIGKTNPAQRQTKKPQNRSRTRSLA